MSSMTVTRVCVVGSINADLTFRVEALPRPGETVLARSLHTAPGGKGANQAVAAARAGARVDFVGAVGSDPAADRLAEHLRRNGIGLDGLSRVPGPSGTATIAVDDEAENAIIVAPGANAHLEVPPEVVERADVVLVQLEIPLSAAVEAARRARGAGATVILNASPACDDDLADLAANTDVVVVNEAEAERWRWETTYLVITRGGRGASIVGPDGRLDVPAHPVEPVDTTGAGDVFAGVLAAGWPADPVLAVRRACVAGALATRVEGAGDCAPTAAAIDEALR